MITKRFTAATIGAVFGTTLLLTPDARALSIQAAQISPISSGAYLAQNEEIIITANGTIDIAIQDGSYLVDPNGTIIQAPAAGTGAYGFFFNQPVIGAPTVGQKKYMNSGNPFGSLLFSFSNSGAPNVSDFSVLGTGGTINAPALGGELYFMVADINNYDNAGSFQVNFSSPVPELSQVSYFLMGSLALFLVMQASIWLPNRSKRISIPPATDA